MPGFDSPPRWHASLGSTNDELLALAATAVPEGTVVAARRQTAGRGRNGRAWISPPGTGLYASLLLRPSMDCGELTLLPLLAGIAAAEAIRSESGCAAGLKWPNDVLISGRKVAGVLVEAEFPTASTSGPQASANRAVVVLGLGVNISTPPESLPLRSLYPATSLETQTGRRVDHEALLAAWRGRVAHWYASWQRGDSAAIRTQWSALDALRGTMLRIASAEGRESCGVDEGVDEEGALLLRGEDGSLTRVVAGDVLRARRRSSSVRC